MSPFRTNPCHPVTFQNSISHSHVYWSWGSLPLTSPIAMFNHGFRKANQIKNFQVPPPINFQPVRYNFAVLSFCGNTDYIQLALIITFLFRNESSLPGLARNIDTLGPSWITTLATIHVHPVVFIQKTKAFIWYVFHYGLHTYITAVTLSTTYWRSILSENIWDSHAVHRISLCIDYESNQLTIQNHLNFSGPYSDSRIHGYQGSSWNVCLAWVIHAISKSENGIRCAVTGKECRLPGFFYFYDLHVALGIVHIFENSQVRNLDHNKSAVGQGGHKINALQNLGQEWSQNW